MAHLNGRKMHTGEQYQLLQQRGEDPKRKNTCFVLPPFIAIAGNTPEPLGDRLPEMVLPGAELSRHFSRSASRPQAGSRAALSPKFIVPPGGVAAEHGSSCDLASQSRGHVVMALRTFVSTFDLRLVRPRGVTPPKHALNGNFDANENCPNGLWLCTRSVF